MTISITRRLKKFIGNGSATEFSYDFYIPDADSVYVVLYNTVTGERTIVDESDYDISGLGDPAFGEVTYPLTGDPISSDYWLIVVRQVDYIQDLDIPNQSTFYPEVLEAKLDDLVMMVQQLAEVQSRTIRMVEGDTVDSILEDGALRANKYLRFDGEGDPSVDAGPIETGVLPLASQGEAEAGSFNAALMTPLRTAQAIEGYAFAVGGATPRTLVDRIDEYIDPIGEGMVPDLSDETTRMANAEALQRCLERQTNELKPIRFIGTFYVGDTVHPTSRVTLEGTSRFQSILLFDARVGGVDSDKVMFDFRTNNVSPTESRIEHLTFRSIAGQTSNKKHTCFQFRTNGSANQFILMKDVYASDWSECFAEIPQSWNCHFEDMYLSENGRHDADSGWDKEGAGLRFGYKDTQGDIVTTGNTFTNFYCVNNNHGIHFQDADVGDNLVLFCNFNNIICEFNRIGIYAPSSRDCYLRGCYFEANTFHGAFMGHARIEGCRYRPDGTDDIRIDHTIYPWQNGTAHYEYFCSEEVCTEGDDGIHEIWAPEYGIISFASPNADFNGLVAVKTDASPAGTALTTFGASFQIELDDPDISMWDTKITLCIPGDGTLKIQNRSGATLEWTYQVMGGKPTGGPAGGFL